MFIYYSIKAKKHIRIAKYLISMAYAPKIDPMNGMAPPAYNTAEMPPQQPYATYQAYNSAWNTASEYFLQMRVNN
jgi:hypothetical protein